MDTNLPKDFKPLALVGLLLLITVAVGFFPAKWFGLKIPDTSNSGHIRIDLTQLTDPNNLATDFDKDGKITWKELIAQNADYSSTTVAESKRGITPNPKVIEQLNDPNNLTASFSKNLYTAGLYLKKNGLTDPDSYQQALNQLIAKEAAKITPTTYKYTDLNILKTDTKDSIKVYGNTIAPLLQTVITKKILTDDLSAINSYAKVQDDESLQLLAENSTHADQILQKLLKLAVPPSAISYHILALNRISLYRDTIGYLSRAETDPLRSVITIDNYSDSVIMVMRLYDQYSEYFNAQNITFSARDPGYLFTAGYTIK